MCFTSFLNCVHLLHLSLKNTNKKCFDSKNCHQFICDTMKLLYIYSIHAAVSLQEVTFRAKILCQDSSKQRFAANAKKSKITTEKGETNYHAFLNLFCMNINISVKKASEFDP